jgi:hypothetical protein
MQHQCHQYTQPPQKSRGKRTHLTPHFAVLTHRWIYASRPNINTPHPTQKKSITPHPTCNLALSETILTFQAILASFKISECWDTYGVRYLRKSLGTTLNFGFYGACRPQIIQCRTERGTNLLLLTFIPRSAVLNIPLPSCQKRSAISVPCAVWRSSFISLNLQFKYSISALFCSGVASVLLILNVEHLVSSRMTTLEHAECGSFDY